MPSTGGYRGRRPQAPHRRGPGRAAPLRPADGARAPDRGRAPVRAWAHRVGAAGRRASRHHGAGRRGAEADCRLLVRDAQEAGLGLGADPRPGIALSRRAFRGSGRRGEGVAHRAALGSGPARAAHRVPHFSRAGGGGTALRPRRRDPQGSPGGAGDPHRSGPGRARSGILDRCVRAPRRRGTRWNPRALVLAVRAVWAEQARALVGLRARLWWRRLVQGRQWARAAIGLLAALIGASFSASLSLLALKSGEEIARRRELLPMPPLAVFAAWVSMALAGRVWFGLIALAQTQAFLDPRRFRAFPVNPLLLSAINLAALLFDPVWLILYPPMIAIAVTVAGIPGAPAAWAMLVAEVVAVFATASILHL